MTNRMIPVGETLLSDMHKDAFGFRPLNVYPAWMSEDEVHAEYDRLQRIICDVMNDENRLALKFQRSLEKRIARYMVDFNIDRPTAFRWEWESAGSELDMGYWAYCNGIAYELVPTYQAELKACGVSTCST